MRSRTEVLTLLWDVIFGKKLTLRKSEIYFSLQLLKSFVFGSTVKRRRKRQVTALVRHQLRFLSRISAKIFSSTRPAQGDDFNKSRVKSCQRKKWIMGKEQDVALVPV